MKAFDFRRKTPLSELNCLHKDFSDNFLHQMDADSLWSQKNCSFIGASFCKPKQQVIEQKQLKSNCSNSVTQRSSSYLSIFEEDISFTKESLTFDFWLSNLKDFQKAH